MQNEKATKADPFLRWQLLLVVMLLSLLPGLRYYMPTGGLVVLKMVAAAAVAWAIYCLLFKLLHFYFSRPLAVIGYGLPVLTSIALVQPTFMFGMLLFAFFRWLFYISVISFVFLLVGISRFVKLRFTLILILVCALIQISFIGTWWNFTMVLGGKFRPENYPKAISVIFSVADLRAQGLIGEAHPYGLAYDDQADLLIASFKDDWGHIFGRWDDVGHNFLALRHTKDEKAPPDFLFFNRTQLPESIAIRPAEKIGWVNVLDVGRRTFHLAEFSYAGDRLTLTRFIDLPFEPNCIFDDRQNNRLLVIGIQMELLELDPETLAIRSFRNLIPDLNSSSSKNSTLHEMGAELSLLDALFDPTSQQLFIATIGHQVHALSLTDFHDRRVPSFPLNSGLHFDPVRRELAVARLLQGELIVIDTDSFQVKQRFDLGLPVRPIAIVRPRDWLLTGSYTRNGTVIVDRQTGRVMHRFALGRLQRNAITDAGGERVFLATGWGVFAIDAAQLP